MKLTNTQIMAAITNATLQQLPEKAILLGAGGYTLVPDHGYWMDKAIQLLSTERKKVNAGLTSLRLRSLAAKGHLLLENAGCGFIYSLPDEQLGQCWFRTRALLRASGIPDYGDKPVDLDPVHIIESTHSVLREVFSIQEADDFGKHYWRIVDNAAVGSHRHD